MQIETITHYQCQLGEGPVWDARRQEICWIDIIKGEIHQYNLAKETHRLYAVHEMIGCFALCPNGDFIIATQSGIGFLSRTTGAITKLVDPESDKPNNRFNDGKCDPAGRFWAGTMSLKGESGVGSVYCFDYKSVVKKMDNMTIPNGLAWSPDHQTLYYIDTPTSEVAAYRYDTSTGTITGRKVIITIPKDEGSPDGMTIDKDGMLWIAHWDGGQVSRWNPATGEKLHHFKLPVSRVTCCTFGGEHLQDLFITSARDGLSEAELAKQPLAGSLFVIRHCGFEGLLPFEFGSV